MKKHISNVTKILLLIINLFGHSVPLVALTAHQETYQDEVFDTVIDRNLALHHYAKEALANVGEKKVQYLKKFFNAFPRDFETYFKMEFPCYGSTVYFLNKDDMNVLVVKSLFRNPWNNFSPVLRIVDKAEEIPKETPSSRFKDFNIEAYQAGYFPRIGEGIPYSIFHDLAKVIPKEIYYQKLVSVQIGAFDCLYRVNGFGMEDEELDRNVDGTTAYTLWVQKILPPFIYQPGHISKRDAQRYGFIENRPDLVNKKHKNNAKELLPPKPDPMVMKVLSEKTNEEILSYWYGYYRGGGNLKSAYTQLITSFPRLAELMIQAGDRILADVNKEHDQNPRDCHCGDPEFY
eukprot:gene230-307_t